MESSELNGLQLSRKCFIDIIIRPVHEQRAEMNVARHLLLENLLELLLELFCNSVVKLGNIVVQRIMSVVVKRKCQI